MSKSKKIDSEEMSDNSLCEQDTSSFSSRDRKRKIEEVESCLISGDYTEKAHSNFFNNIFDESGRQIDRIRCRKCRKLVSSGPGGHKTIHRQGKCMIVGEYKKRKFTSDEMDKIRNTMISYLMKAGGSFHHLESEAYREMTKSYLSIGAEDIDVESCRLPSEEWLRNEVELEGEQIFLKIGEEIHEPTMREECCLVIDFGKKLYDFLSVFIVFIDRSSEKPRLKALPFMFMPVFEEKSAEKIVEYIVEGGEKFNLSRDQILNMRLVGDGASNIRKLGRYFKSYTYCSCHSLQKSAERVLDPLVDSRLSFQLDELQHIQEINEIVDDCGDLALTLRKNKKRFHLGKLPTAYCKTRWMTFINCCQDIIDLFPVIETLDDARVRKIREKIRPKLPQLITATQLLKMFEKPLKIFEETEMRIHEVAPWMFKLLNYFQDEKLKGELDRNFTLETMAKSACVSMEHYIEQTLSDPHLLASYLCPGMRKLSLFPSDYKIKTMELIEKEINLIVIEDSEETKNETDDFARDLYDTPPPPSTAQSELQDYKTSIFSKDDNSLVPIDFWLKYENRFPRLSKIAGSVFCTLSSESICERSFSALNRVFRSDRQSLEPELVEILMVSFLYVNKQN